MHSRASVSPRILPTCVIPGSSAKAHALATILVIAICASIAGANDWVAVAEFGRSKQAWFRTFLDLPNGIPSHDTFWRVFRALDPDHFQTCFLNWIRATSPLLKGQVIAIDGKQLRRSHDKGLGRSAIYMVSAWATANHLVLGHRKVAEKSNEITAIPELLRALDLAGCLVTIDAIGCQTAIAQLIVDQNADYLLALKANQGQLHDDVALLFADLTASQYQAYTHDYAKMSGKGHPPDRASPSLDDQRPAGDHALTACQPVCAFDDRDEGAPRTPLRC